MLCVRVLGALALERDTDPLTLPPGRRLRALLGWLVLHPGPQPRIEVAGTLWPDVLDERARTSLRSALAELRRALGEGWLVATRDAVALADDVWVDVRAFEQLASAGRIEEALELVRGDLLDGLADEWVYDHRERQRERERELLARLASEAERRGDLEGAIGHARRRLDRDVLSEDAGRELIRLLADGGDRAAALEAYTHLAERLRRRLGIAPGPETRRLVQEIRRAAVTGASLPPPELPAPLMRRHRSPFVGRGRALARLRRAWGRARAGERLVVMVAGDAGIGKTRVAGELARFAHDSGAAVLYGRSHPDAGTPFAPFAEALRPPIAAGAPEGILALAGPLAGELARIVPAHADRLPPPGPPPGGDPGGARYRLFEACAALVGGLARVRPTLIVLEDLHWADPTSLALLRHLTRAEPAPLLLVCTYRESDLGPDHPLRATLGSLRRDPGFEGIALGGLPVPDIGALAATWLGDDAPAELVDALADETGGNPFFVEELLRRLTERVGSGDRTWPSAAELGVPRGVSEVIAERLELIGERARETLLVAAVAGREVDVELLAAAARREREALADDLERALDAHLLRVAPGRLGRYAFPHALVREAIYERASAARRTLLHERIAIAVEGLAGDDPEQRIGELAHHYRLAGDSAPLRRKAADYSVLAGRDAERRLAHEEAARHYELALEAVPRGRAAARRRAEIACALGEARLRAGGLQAASETFDQAAAAAREANAPELLARAAIGRSGLAVVVLAPTPATVALLEAALDAVGDRHPALRARLLARLAVELYHASAERREALSAEAMALARAAGARGPLGEALSARHVALWSPPHLGARLAIVAEMIDLAEAQGDPELALQADNWRVTDLCESGDFAAAREAVAEHARRADELRLPSYQWWAPTWQAMLAIADGRFEEAERLAADAHEIAQRTQEPTEALFGWYQALYIRSEREPPSGALPDYVPERVALHAVETAFRPALPAIYAEAGRTHDARAELEELARDRFAAVPRDFNWPSSIALLARGVALLEDAVRAAVLYELLLPYRERAILVGRAGLCHGPTELYLGLLAATCARRQDAERHYDAALRWAERSGAGLLGAWARTYWAETLRSRAGPGDRERASSLAAEALRFAEERALGRLAARARAVMSGLR